MSKIILKCPYCGSTDFELDEGFCWKCYINKEGDLFCHKPQDEIESIECKKCKKEFKEEDFKNIIFE